MSANTLKEHLINSGVLNSDSPEAIQAAKKLYRKNYLKEKKQAFRASHKTISLSFTNEKAKVLLQEAKRNGFSLAHYLKACIEAYRKKIFILPEKSQAQVLEKELNKIGNNINQLVKHCHRRSIDPETALKEIETLLVKLEVQLDTFLRNPKTLMELIKEKIQAQPHFINVLHSFLNKHAPKNHPTQRSVDQKTPQIHD